MTQYVARTSGTGSSFEALVYERPDGGSMFDSKFVAGEKGFQTRGQALAWARRWIKAKAT